MSETTQATTSSMGGAKEILSSILSSTQSSESYELIINKYSPIFWAQQDMMIFCPYEAYCPNDRVPSHTVDSSWRNQAIDRVDRTGRRMMRRLVFVSERARLMFYHNSYWWWSCMMKISILIVSHLHPTSSYICHFITNNVGITQWAGKKCPIKISTTTNCSRHGLPFATH